MSSIVAAEGYRNTGCWRCHGVTLWEVYIKDKNCRSFLVASFALVKFVGSSRILLRNFTSIFGHCISNDVHSGLMNTNSEDEP
jgi:hypothetical protein